MSLDTAIRSADLRQPSDQADSVAVVIPTKDRPEKLARCLQSLSLARKNVDFTTFVCDSSSSAHLRSEVHSVCQRYPFVDYSEHEGANAAAARNVCAQRAKAQLLVSVDDDIRVYPDSIDRLLERYRSTSGLRVVAGSVLWASEWSGPVVMRPIGYGRRARPLEPPDFLVSAFFLYPRAFALSWPWNDRLRSSEDRFMGALWRRKGVALLFEPGARAIHDDERVTYGVEHQACHIYTNLFDSLLANRRPMRALSFEVLGFLAGARYYFRTGKGAVAYLKAWAKGHEDLIRDWSYLRQLVRRDFVELQLSESWLDGDPRVYG